MKLVILLVILKPLKGSAQNEYAYSTEDCGSILNKHERDSVAKFKAGELTFYYAPGKIKYDLVKKNKSSHITYYSQQGMICKEQFLNFSTRVSKTIYYNDEGKKFMVCKGTLKTKN